MNKLFVSAIFALSCASIAAQEILPKKDRDTTEIEVLDEVVLTTVRVARDAPVTHSNVDKEDLETRNLGQDLPVLLNYLPSVVSTTDAGAGVGYTGIRVRGSDATRINVTLNGIPYNDSESQGTFWVNMPDFTSSVESLQLQRGVGTSTNGSGAFGASLNILTDGVSNDAYGEISNSFGSYNTHKHNVKFSTGLLSDHFEMAGRVSMIQSDGYIDRASSDLKSYFLQGAFQDGNTLLKLLAFGGSQKTYQAWNGIEDLDKLENDRTFNPSGMYTDLDGNVRFYDNEVDNYDQNHYQFLWSQRFNSYWKTNLSVNYTRGEGYFEQYKENRKFGDYGLEPIPMGNDTINRTDLIQRRWLDNHFFAVNANVNYKKDNLDVSGGAYYGTYTGDHFGEIIWARYASDSEIRDHYYFGDADKREFTVFSKVSYLINDSWSLYGDVQGRFINYKTSGITSDLVPMVLDEDYAFFNPKAGASYRLNPGNQFYLSYGRAHREPSRTDFRENILTAEKLDDFELGWRFSSDWAKVNTNLYYMLYKDQLVLSGEMSDTGRPLRTSSGSSYRMGVEIDAEINIGPKFRALPNVALSSNKNVDFVASIDGELVDLGKTNIAFSPSVVVGNILEYRPINNMSIGFLSKYVGEQYMGNIDSEKSKLDAYFVNDLNVAYRFELPWTKEVVLSALVNNIFNVKYISNGYFYTYEDDFSNPGQIATVEGAGYFPQATVNFLVGATIKF
jgi:iron complex outermembrane receptor protein